MAQMGGVFMAQMGGAVSHFFFGGGGGEICSKTLVVRGIPFPVLA